MEAVCIRGAEKEGQMVKGLARSLPYPGRCSSPARVQVMKTSCLLNHMDGEKGV